MYVKQDQQIQMEYIMLFLYIKKSHRKNLPSTIRRTAQHSLQCHCGENRLRRYFDIPNTMYYNEGHEDASEFRLKVMQCELLIQCVRTGPRSKKRYSNKSQTGLHSQAPINLIANPTINCTQRPLFTHYSYKTLINLTHNSKRIFFRPHINFF